MLGLPMQANPKHVMLSKDSVFYNNSNKLKVGTNDGKLSATKKLKHTHLDQDRTKLKILSETKPPLLSHKEYKYIHSNFEARRLRRTNLLQIPK